MVAGGSAQPTNSMPDSDASASVFVDQLPLEPVCRR